MTASARRTLWWLIALMWLACGLRVYQLGAQSLWSDEGLTLYRARLSLADNLSNIIMVPPGVPTRDTNPPLYFLTVSGLRLVAGESEYALRFLSALAGVLCVPLLYVLGRRLFSVETGRVAALLGAVSPFLVWYSQEARMYTLLAALSMVSTYILLRALETPSLRLWLAWAVVTSAAWYTHFTLLFLLVFQGGLILVWLTRVKRRSALAALGVLLALSIPLGVYAWSRGQEAVDPSFSLRPLSSIAEEAISTFLVGRSNQIFQPLEIVIPGLLLLAFGIWWALRERPRNAVITLAYLIVPLLAVAGATLLRPVYSGPRHVTVVVPPLYLFMAYGAIGLWRRQRVWGGIALGSVLVIMAYWLNVQFTDPAYVKDDMRSAACTIASRAQPDDVVIVHDAITSYVFDYYYRRCGGQAPWKIIPIYPSMDIDAALMDFQTEADRAARLWFLVEPHPLSGFDPEALDVWARGHLLRLDHQRFPSIWMGAQYQLYTAHFPIFEALPDSAQERAASWPADTLHLAGVDPITITPARDQAQIGLYWRLDRPAQRNFNITVRLVDRSGAEWGLFSGTPFDNWSAKQWPVGQYVRQDLNMALPHGLPPGEYAVVVSVADRQTNEVIPPADGPLEMEIATVKVEP
jgi:mannosyltransferase